MAYRELTHAEQDKVFTGAMNTAKKWFAKGFNTSQIAKGVWNKLGYQCEPLGKDKIKVQRQYNGKGQKFFIVEVELV